MQERHHSACAYRPTRVLARLASWRRDAPCMTLLKRYLLGLFSAQGRREQAHLDGGARELKVHVLPPRRLQPLADVEGEALLDGRLRAWAGRRMHHMQRQSPGDPLMQNTTQRRHSPLEEFRGAEGHGDTPICPSSPGSSLISVSSETSLALIQICIIYA